MAQDTVQVNLRSMFLALIVVIALIVFSVGALANGDPLWFVPIFDETPKRIVVYQAGCSITLTNGQPGFTELNAAINQTVPQYEGYNSTFGISPESLQEYREKGRAVEVLYAKPITIHTSYKFGYPTVILIPLDGYLGQTRSVFGGNASGYWAGALRLKSNAAIASAVEKIACPAR